MDATKSKKSLFEKVFNKDKLTNSKPLFENLNALNVYPTNI